MHNKLLKLCVPFLFIFMQVRGENPENKYIFSTEKVTFLDGFIQCKQRGMDPVEIITEVDEKELEAALPVMPVGYLNGYWIFATNFGTQPNYYWLNSGHALSFSQFLEGEPNNMWSGENCLEIFRESSGKFKWNDTPCNRTYKFICQNRTRQHQQCPNGADVGPVQIDVRHH